ncbi:uncharacterized protein LOC118743866 [Rhagoletis pomonella]|uniref:uncharacterized protein LOC118743866 n=1 Tax=Rhagoletis pomonella TaxID=28610 RepID=UPI001782D3AC|nr:uncharacterized protein LOC118743866 [Rhagoletis pomonella]
MASLLEIHKGANRNKATEGEIVCIEPLTAPKQLLAILAFIKARQSFACVPIENAKLYGTMPNPIKSAPSTYKNQPGRIEDYVTGRSSVSEKERKEWWDEVMDIFNGHLDQAKLSPHYTEGNLSRALAKESGYTSDSNLVFRKREAPQASPLSPVEQKQAYKSVQAGGEPPLFGFRKPAPERPRGKHRKNKTESLSLPNAQKYFIGKSKFYGFEEINLFTM